jgi:hypothetical protein
MSAWSYSPLLVVLVAADNKLSLNSIAEYVQDKRQLAGKFVEDRSHRRSISRNDARFPSSSIALQYSVMGVFCLSLTGSTRIVDVRS